MTARAWGSTAISLWVQLPGDDPAVLSDALPAPQAVTRVVDAPGRPSRVLWLLRAGGGQVSSDAAIDAFLDVAADLRDAVHKLADGGADVALEIAGSPTAGGALAIDAPRLARLAALGFPVSFVAREAVR